MLKSTVGDMFSVAINCLGVTSGKNSYNENINNRIFTDSASGGATITSGSGFGGSIGASGGGIGGGAGGGGGGFNVVSGPIPQPAPLSQDIQDLISLGIQLTSTKKTTREKFNIFLQTLSIKEIQELLNDRNQIMDDIERVILLNA